MTTVTSRSRVDDRREDRRTELLEELVELFLAEGFAHLSVADLATRLSCSKSTLYLVAASKEQIVVTAVRHYFRRAADRVEARVAGCDDPAARLTAYLTAVSDELRPASVAFRRDLAGYPPAAVVYRDNTTFAARRVQQLVADGVAAGALRTVDAAFAGAAVRHVMTAIQSGDVTAETGLADAAAYEHLADLVTHGLLREGR